MKSVLLGIPTGWHVYEAWLRHYRQWCSGQRVFELVDYWAPSNTKAAAYSELVDKAREGRFDYLWLLETNIYMEAPIQKVFERANQFHCVFSPGRFTDDTLGCNPLFLGDGQTAHDLPVDKTAEGEPEFLPIESRWGCTHFVSMDRHTYQSLGTRFMWALKDNKLDHDMPIYCYDGDTWPDHPDPFVGAPDAGNPVRRLAIEQSLFSNVRAQGIGVWADPQLYSTNMRLGSYYRSMRYKDFVK